MVIFFVAALITPPDIVSQVMIAVPMLALYELSILLCSINQRLFSRKEPQRAEPRKSTGTPGE